MTTQTQAPPNLTVERIRDMMKRRGWTIHYTARYLGVPEGTLGNWLQGTRTPNTVVERLLDILGTIEMMSPTIHSALLPTKGGK